MTERTTPLEKSADAFRTIGEVAEDLRLPQHVLRFWETRFPQVKPLKRAGGRRFYRPEDVALIRAIQELLYGKGYTIKGVQRMLQEQGPRGLLAGPPMAPPRSETMAPGRPPDPRSGATADVAKDEPPILDQRAAGGKGPSTPFTHDLPRPVGGDARPRRRPAPHLIDRLHAVASDLKECERLLAAARSPLP